MGAITVREDDLSGEPTQALLALHLAGMHETSPAGHVFALDLSGLQAPGVTVWSAWRDGRIAGIGALKDHGDGLGANEGVEGLEPRARDVGVRREPVVRPDVVGRKREHGPRPEMEP